MTKVLLIGGEDYAALRYEQEVDLTAQEAFDMAEDNNGRIEVVYDHGVIVYSSHEIDGEVSDEFLMFVRDCVQDYDASKHTTFIVLR